jgi:transcriptional regulator with XRE-family HTH domain
VAGRGSSPAVARRRVRITLRRAREAMGLTQGVVAARMGWSLSKVQRIESGENAVSGTDLRALLDLYEVTDSEEIEQLSEEARISRRQRWWTKREFREQLTPAMLQLAEFEAEAVAIRTFQPVVVPGQFQTPAYAEFMFGMFGDFLSDQQRKIRFEARMERRKLFLEPGDNPQVYMILDESVLKREVGGLDVMAEQLESLAELAHRPDIHMRIAPFRVGVIMGSGGQITVLDLADEDEDGAEMDAVLYLESFTHDSIEHDPKEVAFHRQMFQTVWDQSLNRDKTIRALSAEAASFRAQIDRN